MIFSKSKRYALCLSGGGLRAISHLGVLQAIEDHNIKICAISGTSAGAIIAALYAKGYSPKEMLDIVSTNNFFGRQSLKFRGPGIFDNKFLYQLFQKYFPENDFSSFKMPVFIAASDLTEGKTTYFNQGNLHDALMASCSIPFVFPNKEIGNRIYCDGGLFNNLPIEPLQEQKYCIVAVHANGNQSVNAQSIKKMSTRAYLERILNLGISNHVYAKSSQCDLFIEAKNLAQYSIFDKTNAQKLFDLGYQAAEEAIIQYLKKQKKWWAI